MLSSVVLASLNSARAKARDARRLADLKEMQKALELFFDDNGRYPYNRTSSGGAIYSGWYGTTAGCYGNSGSVVVLDGLVGKYIPSLPIDPNPRLPSFCYLYRSINNGADYKFLVYNTVESFNPRAENHPLADSSRSYSFSIHSPGGNF